MSIEAVTALPIPSNTLPPALRIEVMTTARATVVRPLMEWLDIGVAPEFRMALVDLIKAGHRNLVIDLAAVRFIDSSGLSALVSALKMLKTGRDRRKGTRADQSRRPVARGDVRLAAVVPSVLSLLEIIRMDRVFPIYRTVAEAADSF